jgi:hypothetical protein
MTKIALSSLLALATVGIVASTDYPAPQPTYEAGSFTTWDSKTIKNSKKAKIDVPITLEDGSSDYISMYRLDLVGNDHERGFAHGYLMAKGRKIILPSHMIF